MNSICKFTLVIFSVLVSACFSNDDDYGPYIDVASTDAFTFDNQKNYVVGDTIYFDQKFSRYLKESGFESLLDIYETTNDSNFGYSFGLSKYSDFSDSYVNVSINTDFIISSSVATYEYYFYDGFGAVAELNLTKDAYESRIGIILAETGDFKLNFENIHFRNDYEGIHLDIQHSFSTDNASDFEFTVIE